MIHFNCPACSRAFTVRDQDAGRRARCRTCGSEVVVPQTTDEAAGDDGEQSPAAGATTPKRIPMRIRRLTADAEQMRLAFANSPYIRVISTEGNPPELYRLAYTVKSLDRGKKPNQPVTRHTHEVEIQLTSEYPRISPKCRMLTPIFHPNIDPTTICVGDHWAAGERLADLAVRIGEMLAYQAYNIKSPLDAEAAMWADLNQDQLPTDKSDLRPAE